MSIKGWLTEKRNFPPARGVDSGDTDTKKTSTATASAKPSPAKPAPTKEADTSAKPAPAKPAPAKKADTKSAQPAPKTKTKPKAKAKAKPAETKAADTKAAGPGSSARAAIDKYKTEEAGRAGRAADKATSENISKGLSEGYAQKGRSESAIAAAKKPTSLETQSSPRTAKVRERSRLRRAVGGVRKYARRLGRAVVGKSTEPKRVSKWTP